MIEAFEAAALSSLSMVCRTRSSSGFAFLNKLKSAVFVPTSNGPSLLTCPSLRHGVGGFAECCLDFQYSEHT